MKKISLCIVAHSRQQNLYKIAQEIAAIDEKHKKDLSVIVMNDFFQDNQLINTLEKLFKDNGIDFKNIILDDHSYFSKCIFMSQLGSEYIIKYDEDIYMTSSAWNMFFEDLVNVNWDQAGCYAPLITSGIPGIEMFLDHYVDEKTRDYFREEFSNIKIDNLWGATYDELIYRKDNPYDFFEQVRSLDHYYKGIHPIRVSMQLQNFLVDYIMANKKIWEDPKFLVNLIDYKPAYFCNSVFLTKTKMYREAIEKMLSGELINDGYDEVGLNQYIEKSQKSFIFNINCVAVHPSYNTIGQCYGEISAKFYANT